MSIQNRESPSSNENYNQVPNQHVHPEAMPSSQTLAGERRPGDAIHPMDVDPSRKKSRNIKFAAAAMVGSVFIAGATWLSLKSEGSEIKQLTPAGETSQPLDQTADMGEEMFQPSPEVSTPTSDEIGQMGSVEFSRLDTTLRLDAMLDRLETDKPVALDIISEKYNSAAENDLLAQSTGNSMEGFLDQSYTDQDVLNNYTAGLAAASAQGTDIESINKSQKLLSIVMSPDNPNFNDMVGDMNGKFIRSFFAANQDYRYNTVKDTTFMGEEVGSEGARLIRAARLGTNDEILMQFNMNRDSSGRPNITYTNAYNLKDNYELEYELWRFQQN